VVTNAELRDELRPQGVECPSCASCQWRLDCGGFSSGRLFGTCFDHVCCEFNGKDKSICNAVCPYKDDFNDWLKDTGGIRFDDLPSYSQPLLDLPQYIPVVDHRSRRHLPLEWPFVALNTYNVLRVRRKSGEYEAVADDPAELRDAFLLGRDTQILLRGIARDFQLERYWENRLPAQAPAQLSRLGIHSAIGPNFSHFLDLPRTDHLFNRRRQLICLAELASAELTTIPHLNAVMPGDWRFWQAFLRRNASIHCVAVEFQTGNKNPKQGKKAIEQLAIIQRQLGRKLHPVIVGGAQFVEFVSTRFERFTLMDSAPFFRTMQRYCFDRSAGKDPWREGFTLVGQSLDGYLLDNIAGYSAWIDERVRRSRSDMDV